MGEVGSARRKVVYLFSQTRLLRLSDGREDEWFFRKEKLVYPCKKNKCCFFYLEDKYSKNYQKLVYLVQAELNRNQRLFQTAKPLFTLIDENGCVLWRKSYIGKEHYKKKLAFKGTEKEHVSLVSLYKIREKKLRNVHRGGETQLVLFDGVSSQPLAVLEVDSKGWLAENTRFFKILKLIAENLTHLLANKEREKKAALYEYLVAQKNKGILCDARKRIIQITGRIGITGKQWIGKRIEEIQLLNGSVHLKEAIYLENECIGFYYEFLQDSISLPTNFLESSSSPVYQEIINKIFLVAKTNMPVHLFGETGTGKEVVAHMIHANSPMAKGPLISINCGAVHEKLLESELFGYAPGAFTGASQKGYAGKIRLANGGTLFLDEIDSMPKKMQSALLRVLEEKRVSPVGSEASYSVDFRLVTASNKELRKLVKNNAFRMDLFYRIYVYNLTIPPLRERKEDISEFIRFFAVENQWFPEWLPIIEKLAVKKDWNGNIRELMNFLNRLFLFYPVKRPTIEQIQHLICIGDIEGRHVKKLVFSEEENERERIIKALHSLHYHYSNTAKALGISRSTLYRKMKEYQIN